MPRRADEVDNIVGTLMEYERMTMDLTEYPFFGETSVTGLNEFNLMGTSLRGL